MNKHKIFKVISVIVLIISVVLNVALLIGSATYYLNDWFALIIGGYVKSRFYWIFALVLIRRLIELFERLKNKTDGNIRKSKTITGIIVYLIALIIDLLTIPVCLFMNYVS